MTVIRLIAWREYLENVRTRGFWIGILLIPALVIGMYLVQMRLAEVSPRRHFLLLDQSGNYAGAIRAAIDLEHQRQVLQEFVQYLLDHRKQIDPELTSAAAASAADQLIEDVGADEAAALNQWIENGGLDVALAMASPYLREGAPPFVRPENPFIEVPLPPEIDATAGTEELLERLRPYLVGTSNLVIDRRPVELFALVLVPPDVDHHLVRPGSLPAPALPAQAGVQYWARNLTDRRLPDAVERGINGQVRSEEFLRLGVDATLVRNVQRTRLPFNRLDPGATAGEEAVSMADTFRQYAPIIFVYLMFIALMQSVQYLLTNTIEEKSNRILEVLLASVTPDELLLGKMLGIGLGSLTTLAAWVATLLLFLNLYQSSETQMLGQILQVIFDSDLVPWFVFYCLAGYGLYAGIFLAIGSLCNTLKEAQGLMVPVIVMMVVPITITPFVVLDPNHVLYRALSWFPLFTPYLMMNRAAANPPVLDVIGTTVLLLASIVVMLWLSGRVFRHGLLRAGQPPRFAELLRLIRNKGL